MSNIKTPKEWFEESKYVYDLEVHDEGGFIGIDEDKVAEMLDDRVSHVMEQKIEELEGAVVNDDAIKIGWNAQNSIGFRQGIRQAIEILKK